MSPRGGILGSFCFPGTAWGGSVSWPWGDLGSALPPEPGPSLYPLTSSPFPPGSLISSPCGGVKYPLDSHGQFAFGHSFVFLFLSAQNPWRRLCFLTRGSAQQPCHLGPSPCRAALGVPLILGSCRSSGLWVTDPRLGAGDLQCWVPRWEWAGGEGRSPLRETEVA